MKVNNKVRERRTYCRPACLRGILFYKDRRPSPGQHALTVWSGDGFTTEAARCPVVGRVDCSVAFRSALETINRNKQSPVGVGPSDESGGGARHLQLPQRMSDEGDKRADPRAVFSRNFIFFPGSFVLFNKSGSLNLNRSVIVSCFFVCVFYE